MISTENVKKNNNKFFRNSKWTAPANCHLKGKEGQAEDLGTNRCRKRQKGVQTSESDSEESGCESESGSNIWAV